MKIEVVISARPLRLEPCIQAGCGAVVRFDGVVRGEEAGKPIVALEYEAYEPMAERIMHELLVELARDCPCELVRVQHRTGVVPVGEAAIVIEAQSRHRAAALELVTRFMDRLKQEVPIWKVRTLEGGGTESKCP